MAKPTKPKLTTTQRYAIHFAVGTAVRSIGNLNLLLGGLVLVGAVAWSFHMFLLSIRKSEACAPPSGGRWLDIVLRSTFFWLGTLINLPFI